MNYNNIFLIFQLHYFFEFSKVIKAQSFISLRLHCGLYYETYCIVVLNLEAQHCNFITVSVMASFQFIHLLCLCVSWYLNKLIFLLQGLSNEF